MQDMRYLNLFSQITGVNTRFFAKYNDMLIFCVPKNFVFRAIGEDAQNLRQMSSIIKKKIRVVPMPRGIQDARLFIEGIIKPAIFKSMEITPIEIIITAGSMQNKATLIGRNKRRFLEMQKIIREFFNREFRIA
jgi:transcription antitermination factor NusA-like protein